MFEKKVNIVVLAAGIGRRLKPLTNEKPKPLISVNNEPIITRLLKNIPEESVESLTIVVGYLGELIEDAITKMKLPYSVSFYKNNDYRSTHCSSSLIEVQSLLGQGALIFNSDVVYSDKAIEKIFSANFDSSFIVCKSLSIPNTDLQKVLYDNQSIIKEWSLVLDNFNGDVIGPVYISQKKGIELQRVIVGNRQKIKQLPCFTFLSNYLVDGDTKVVNISHNEAFEIDTLGDLNYCEKIMFS